MTARIYLRKNGSFGSSCDNIADTGHHISEDSGLFTVHSADDIDKIIAAGVTREQAEWVIDQDWKASL